MQAFKYKGYDAFGSPTEGEITGASIEEVERRVAAQDVTIISIIPASMARKRSSANAEGGPIPPRQKKVATSDLALLLRDMAVMAETGVPFVEALDALIASAKSVVVKESLTQLKSQVVGGKGLSAGMRSAPRLFPPLVCDMVKVAEEGGRLDKALASAASYVERAAALRKKIINAMLYPAVLTFVAVATVGVLIVFVLPRFSSIFDKMGGQIPITTKLMLGTGTAIRSYPVEVVLALMATCGVAYYLLRQPVIAATISGFSLKVPILGDLIKKLAFSRAFQSIATLLTSNVPVLFALEHGARVSGNRIVESALMEARDDVEKGASLSEALGERSLFPPMLVQMVSVGERSGRLPQLMTNMANHIEEDADAKLKALISIVEPLMIVVMGTIVGFITLSIIIPIYSFVENVK